MESRSYALPAWMYRNPADVVEGNQMMASGCSACKSAFKMMGITRCEDQRNEFQRGVPSIGSRCKYFIPAEV